MRVGDVTAVCFYICEGVLDGCKERVFVFVRFCARKFYQHVFVEMTESSGHAGRCVWESKDVNIKIIYVRTNWYMK